MKPQRSLTAALIVWLSLFCVHAVPSEAAERGVFVSMIQKPSVFSSKKSMEKLLEDLQKIRATTLYLQVYRENRSWFASKHADETPYRQAARVFGEDAFAFLLRQAHSKGIRVHAWLNLMSLSDNQNALILKKYGPGVLTRNLTEKKNLEDYRIDNQFFLDPGDPRVRAELSAIVTDLVKTYPDLDGIQFDYIRYPDVHPVFGHNKQNVKRFREATGKRSADEGDPVWEQWKRDQVTEILTLLRDTARRIRPDIAVSTTGLVSYLRASQEASQDWVHWVRSGLIDFVTLMVYTHEDTARFERCVRDGKNRLGSLEKANLAVGPYALLKSPEIFAAQWDLCEDAGPRSCVVFHYGSLLENPDLEKPLLEKRTD